MAPRLRAWLRELTRRQDSVLSEVERVLLSADDFTLHAGHADGALMAKTLYMEQWACFLKIPTIKLVDGSSGMLHDWNSTPLGLTASGGGSITTYETDNGSYHPEIEFLPFMVRIRSTENGDMLISRVRHLDLGGIRNSTGRENGCVLS